MKTEKHIEKLIQQLDAEPSEQMYQNTRKDMLNAYTQSKTTALRTQPNIWSTIMQSKLSRLAVAAVIILAITTALYTGFNGTTVNAAEVLQEVIRTNQAYQGWIHIDSSWVKEGEDKPVTGVRHMNTVDGAFIWEDTTEGQLKIKYHSPSRDEYIEYDSKSKEIALYNLNSFPAKALVDSWPLTVDAKIASFKEATGRDPYEITMTQEDDLDRFDIQYFENNAEEIRISKEKSTGFSTSLTLWVDRDSRLIRKSVEEIQSKKLTSMITGWNISGRFSYGEPVIGNVYDLGVPRDALVKDYRMTPALEELFNRLKKRIANFPRYVAVKTESSVNDDGSLVKDYCGLRLYAQNDDAWLVRYYPVGAKTYKNRTKIRPSLMPSPGDWPVVDIQDVLSRAKHMRPVGYYTYNGEEFWSNNATVHEGDSKEQQVDSIRADMGIMHDIWFGETPASYGTGTKAKLISREDKPGLIGLCIEYHSYLPTTRHERYYWFDPKRDDMPAEKQYLSYMKDGTSVEREWRSLYLDYAQLPDGRWYPARWQETTTDHGESPYTSTTECHLTLSTDIALEAHWFSDPNELPVHE
jgi:hypothetical protein